MNKPSILVLNSGSSSLKFAIVDPLHQQTMASGIAERIGKSNAELTLKLASGKKIGNENQLNDHHQALNQLMLLIDTHLPEEKFTGVGHRVVHGGEFFRESVIVNDDVIEKIDLCSHLAPLHNPANIAGIRAMSQQLPDLPQVAVFDTAFHQSLPAKAFTYALPENLYKKHGLRRYGFHGTSHRYVTMKAAKLLNKSPTELNLVTAHLGNGCSATAIKNGRSVDTTMGMTPLEGLVMGTRSGDVDPGLLMHLQISLGFSVEDIDRLLNRESGLLGISGISNDMRKLLEEASTGSDTADLAISVFCYRLAKSLASLAVPVFPLDALVFTGGIGENARQIRAQVCQQLGVLGLIADPQANDSHGRDNHGVISSVASKFPVLVIPTDEELMIALDTHQLLATP